MLTDSHAFSGFSVPDLAAAKEFYEIKLGLNITQDEMGLHLHFASGAEAFVYEKTDHVPASFTILNFPVNDINTVVQELTKKGVVFERYELGFAEQDDKGILRGRAAKMGPDIAWFTDPAGNVLSVLQN